VQVNGQAIAPGQRLTVDLPVGKLYTHTALSIPVHVVNGRRSGPRLFVSAAIHGDEINGVEVIRRLLKVPQLRYLRGTLFAIPIVNVHGLLHHSRYLPDRRDLNRSFPGSERGSLTARVAHLFMTEIVAQCTHGIDLHTGAVHRANLPQIRAKLDDPDTARLASAFGVPVIINSDLRDGSLREVAAARGIPMLLYEAGEALRFDEVSIRAGVHGVISVMRALGMLAASGRGGKDPREPFVARSSAWVRAPQSGILRTVTGLGQRVRRDDLLGTIGDPFGEDQAAVRAPTGGVVIGRVMLPLVNEGDALFHLARFEDASEVAAQVEAFQTEAHEPLGLLDEELPLF
jgi:predicted deacylase